MSGIALVDYHLSPLLPPTGGRPRFKDVVSLSKLLAALRQLLGWVLLPPSLPPAPVPPTPFFCTGAAPVRANAECPQLGKAK